MSTLTETYLSRAEAWLFITTLTYFAMNGAQIFETAVLVPKWTASPPASLKLLTDPHGMSLKSFWILFHSLHEITFILAIIFCWKIEPIRNGLLILFGLHVIIRIWTLLYFAPGIMEFQRISVQVNADTILAQKVSLWKSLNYLRVGLFIAVSMGLIPLCYKIIHLKA